MTTLHWFLSNCRRRGHSEAKVRSGRRRPVRCRRRVRHCACASRHDSRQVRREVVLRRRRPAGRSDSLGLHQERVFHRSVQTELMHQRRNRRRIIVQLHVGDFRSDNRSDNRQRKSARFSLGLYSSQIIAEIFVDILWPTYKSNELSARPLISRQECGQAAVKCIRVYILAWGSRVPLLAPIASDTRIHFSVRQARDTWPVTFVYISVCDRRVPLLAPSY